MRRLALFSLLPTVLLLAACHEQELLSHLTEQQANEVVAVLQVHDVAVNKEDLGKTGYGVTVAQADFSTAVDLLRQFKLPSPARVEVAQAFPADALVASPQAEQARLLSAVEQRLEQNLAALQNVASARVQVSYPLDPTENWKSAPPMHASVLIAYRNEVDQTVLIAEVKRFVKNSFSNISYDDISVILERAPTLFRARPSMQPAGSWPTPLYWLLGISAVVTAAAVVVLISWRWRRNALNTSHPQGEPTLIPRHAGGADDPAVATDLAHHGDMARAEAPVVPDEAAA